MDLLFKSANASCSANQASLFPYHEHVKYVGRLKWPDTMFRTHDLLDSGEVWCTIAPQPRHLTALDKNVHYENVKPASIHSILQDKSNKPLLVAELEPSTSSLKLTEENTSMPAVKCFGEPVNGG